MNIRSLSNTSFERISEAFIQAFADYEVSISTEQLRLMLKRRGFNPDLSFAVFIGEDIVAFTFNGIGYYNGKPTAYDTGTGTLKEYRGQGLATQIFEYSIPYLKEHGIEQYLLEVLQNNTKAISMYRNLGFEIVREFNYFMQKNGEIVNKTKNSDLSCSIWKIEIEEYSGLSGYWDFIPSWQNSFESIKRASEELLSFGAFIGDNLVGYCVFDPTSGDITQIAVDRPYRRDGVASLLLNEIMKWNKSDIIKVLNTDISCDSISAFLKTKNIEMKGKQFEMIKSLLI